MIRDVEYGHAEYVLYKYQYAANKQLNSENWSLL